MVFSRGSEPRLPEICPLRYGVGQQIQRARLTGPVPCGIVWANKVQRAPSDQMFCIFEFWELIVGRDLTSATYYVD
jgi:hypothetical protein